MAESNALLFCLFKYFPFGGLQRRFMQIATACEQLGFTIHVYTFEWQGDMPEQFNVTVLPMCSRFNHKRPGVFAKAVAQAKQSGQYQKIIGFNKMPGIDIYYAADPCYLEKLHSHYAGWYRYTPRARAFSEYEKEIFDPKQNTQILLISENEKPHFIKHHATRDTQFCLLPPGIAKDRLAPPKEEAQLQRKTKRDEFNLTEKNKMLLMIGSGFATKGLDRAIHALAALPNSTRHITHLYVCGQGHAAPYEKLAQKLGVTTQLHVLGGRKDIPDLLLAADVLLQPSVTENTGSAIIEAIASGLPVLANSVCGYAKYVLEAQAGRLIPAPYAQTEFNTLLTKMLCDDDLNLYATHAHAYTRTQDFTALPNIAAQYICGI